MPDLTTADVTELGWIPFDDPRDAVHHAHAAWVHAGTRALLVLIWFPDSIDAGGGAWEWEVRVRGGYREKRLVQGEMSVGECQAAVTWADMAVERLLRMADADNL